MQEKERELWARHLALKDGIANASLKGRFKEAEKLEGQLQALEDRLFSRWRRKEKASHHPPEEFSYKIPVVEAEPGRLLGHKVADQDGVHDPADLDGPLPPNGSHREWLKVIEPSRDARERATRTWRALGHAGQPRCIGCRRRSELTYLEFRNWDDSDRFKIPHVLAVCDESAAELLERSRAEVFGVTAVGTKVKWPCAAEIVHAPGYGAAEAPCPQVRKSRRGGWRGDPRSLANLRQNRPSGSRGRPDSLSVESA